MWDAWKCYPLVTEAFHYIARHPFEKLEMDSKVFQLLDKFIVVVYDKGSDSFSVNETRQHLFCKQNRDIERIPPTRGALYQHTLRARNQASIWITSDIETQDLPSPQAQGWGWTWSDTRWTPVVT
eukprot:Pompholyxophrys_punicea_v1_NODE_1169_length_892_cov_1.544803.p2 type:complete len:125 gc:universal NODE_1169_length_892_cov_1.544803:157-531(+)